MPQPSAVPFPPQTEYKMFSFTSAAFCLRLPSVAPTDQKPSKSAFDIDLSHRWSRHMKLGNFNFDLERVRRREVKGEFGYLVEINPERAAKRRKAQVIGVQYQIQVPKI